jgi:hypothetical protein
MTPKEKAIELVDKFNKPDITYYPYVHNAQQCALIAVDEILRIINLEMPDCCETIDKFIYWNKVRRQIEAI